MPTPQADLRQQLLERLAAAKLKQRQVTEDAAHTERVLADRSAWQVLGSRGKLSNIFPTASGESILPRRFPA